MKGVYYAEDFKKADSECSVDGINLTKRAAAALKEELTDYIGKKMAIVCGNGNNGGDGYALCCLLDSCKIKFDVFGFEGVKSKNCEFFLNKLMRSGIAVKNPINYSAKNYDITVDCIFGIGLNRNVEGVYANVINEINQSLYVVSADIPSGLNSDSGKVMGICVRADKTISFSAYKVGQLINGRNYCNEIIIKDIGVTMPQAAIETADGLPEIILKRPTDSHKGDYGKITVIGGCELMPNAPFFASRAAYRAGAGLVKTVVPACNLEAAKIKAEEEILGILPVYSDNVVKFDENSLISLLKCDVIVCGPGMGGGDTAKIVRYLINNFKKPLILDADALNSVKEKDFYPTANSNGHIILTPHLKEFSRLIDKEIDLIKSDILKETQDFVEKTGVVLLLKGATTIIKNKQKTYLNITGSPCMAKAGSGDILSGIIGALAARVSPLKAALFGAYIHGKAGIKAEKAIGVNSVTVKDMIDNIMF